MATTYSDQFFILDPANPVNVGSTLQVQFYDLVDQNDDGDVDRFNEDSVNGFDVIQSWPGDTVTIDVPGEGEVTYTGTTFYLAGGLRVFTPTDGQLLQEGTFVSSTFVTTQGPLIVPDDLGPACFTPGTMIMTPTGEQAIEALQPGDLVVTADNGPQPILWIGRTQVMAEGTLAPIRFEAGILGLTRPLMVSPQHRMVIKDWRSAYFFGHKEVLVPAHTMVNGTTVTRVEGGNVDYIHLLFAQHEVIFANGAASESYFPGNALAASDRKTQAEILALFPKLDHVSSQAFLATRPVLKAYEAALVAI